MRAARRAELERLPPASPDHAALAALYARMAALPGADVLRHPARERPGDDLGARQSASEIIIYDDPNTARITRSCSP
jgi:hypothetical protein